MDDKEITVDTLSDMTDEEFLQHEDSIETMADKPEAEIETEESQPQEEPEATESEDTPEPTPEIDYKGFYSQVMQPFKANGRQMTLQSPEEAIKLMQMGANYTRKMQEIAPHRKALEFLKQQNMLDEGTLTFMADLKNGNPAAIKKLLKDSKVDYDSLAPSYGDDGETQDVPYTPSTAMPTDADMSFKTTLNDLSNTAAGQRILTDSVSWDDRTKTMLYNTPQLLSTLVQEKELGNYDLVTSELNRQYTLGNISPDIPFIQAYAQVEKTLAQAGMLKGRAVPQPVTTRPYTGMQATQSNDRARSAGTPRTSGKAASAGMFSESDLENLSDEDFMKKYGNFF